MPTLYVVSQIDGGAVVAGSFLVEHEGRKLDGFAIEIDLRPVRGGKLPEVRETGGRIPRTEARHANPDGTACVCHPADYFQRHPGQFDLMAFIEGPVRDYFIGQALVERGDPWPCGEWDHGDAGTNQWFKGFLEDLSVTQMEAYFRILALRDLKGHVVCPCGSGMRVRDCHLPFLRVLRTMVTPTVAKQMLARPHAPTRA